ncbi:hypothetical protein IGS68_33505 (plasmid) [Skermanella sp. TT6]|uniref:Primase n=1 Tax=Skermanella cutis TaxID=2775420 RepID=A0ABX7BGP6_9PROT|nr:hypothetical protein [Skermanella sp. TT6]QQP93539.1 hypothetical protein IGS68_33505 [Skermanella sp. TT6]
MLTLPPDAMTTGLKTDMVQEYNFEDQTWNQPGHVNHHEWFQFLSTRAVAVAGQYWLRDRRTGTWNRYNSKETFRAQIVSQYTGVQDWPTGPLFFDVDVINQYLSLAMPVYEALIYAPGVGEQVVFDDRKRLNVFVNNRLRGETDDIPAAEELLKIIRNSLCAEPKEIGLEAMLKEIREARTLFAWVIHWLAARYQRPGFTSQTNLWLIGRARGIGKSSLVGLMRYLLGSATVQKVVEEEITRGWDDFMFGKELVEWDEFGGKTYHDYSNYIKLKTGNDTVTLTTRGMGIANHLAVAMHIFTTNNEKPMMVDAEDRQNTYVQTTEDPDGIWRKRASALWNSTDNSLVDRRIATGFAAILATVEIDYDFIRKPFQTELRAKLVENFSSTIGQWIDEEQETLVEDWGNRFRKWAEMHGAYADWAKLHTKARPEDLKTFKVQMVKFWKEKTGGDVVEGVGKDGFNNRKSFRGVKLVGVGGRAVVIDDQDF